jgi:mannose-6-phosphate isomerase-like protein (cupin superfamily)
MHPVLFVLKMEALNMEHIDMNGIKEFHEHKVVKKVPLLSSNLMSSLLFIGTGTKMLPVPTKGSEEMHFILEGSGSIEIEDEVQGVDQGVFLLIPPHSHYHYITLEQEMTVLLVKQVDHSQIDGMKTKEETLENTDGEE